MLAAQISNWQHCFSINQIDLVCVSTENLLFRKFDLEYAQNSSSSLKGAPESSQLSSSSRVRFQGHSHSAALSLSVSHFKPHLELLAAGKTLLFNLLNSWCSIKISSLTFVKFLAPLVAASTSASMPSLQASSSNADTHNLPLSNSFCVVTIVSPFEFQALRDCTTQTVVALDGMARLQLAYWQCEPSLQLEVNQQLHQLLSLSQSPIDSDITSGQNSPTYSSSKFFSDEALTQNALNLASSSRASDTATSFLLLPCSCILSLMPRLLNQHTPTSRLTKSFVWRRRWNWFV